MMISCCFLWSFYLNSYFALYWLSLLFAMTLTYNLVSAEHDIFGEAVSDSEEEETNINIMELEDETSRPSADDSRLSDSMSLQV